MKPARQFSLVVLFLLTANLAFSQVTGRISGTVTDPTGNVIIGAAVSIVNAGTGEERSAPSNETGSFVFTALRPSTYTLRVQSEGFQVLEQTNIAVTANQAVALGNVQLVLGSVTETVTVQAEGARVETDTSGVNQMLDTNQLEGLMQRGRDVVALLTVLPGVSQTASSDALGGNWGTNTPNFSGARSGWNNFMLDGHPGNDIDATSTFHVSVSMDAIQEVSVKSAAYQAEYGRTPGAQVNIISKSGTNAFHGSAYWFKRHEMFNANTFDNNRFGLEKPISRFLTMGAVLGGPIKKDKFFFFVSREDWRIKFPGRLFRSTVPTGMERNGDFSASIEQNGSLIPITDPNTGNPFPNNVIPASRINREGQGLLNFLPEPNAPGRFQSEGINYLFQEAAQQPKGQWQFKFDFTPTQSDRITFRPRFWDSDLRAQFSTVAFNPFNTSIYKQPHHYQYLNRNYQGTYTKTLSPTLINEFSFGFGKSIESSALNSEFQLTNIRKENNPGLEGLGQLFPEANPLNLIPSMSFGGVPNAPAVQYDPRVPIAAHDERPVIHDNVSWITGNHTFKFGGYWELNDASEGPRSSAGLHVGTFNFQRDSRNPFDTNHPFSNAITGNFFSYGESSGQTEGLARTYTLEWFAQDTWKVTPNLTLDIGLRFSSFTPWRLRENEGSAFAIDRFTNGTIPNLYQPGINASGKRVAFDPVGGGLFPAPFIGAYVPGTGDRFNGVVVGDGNADYIHGYRERPAPIPQPRFGFAYDPSGKGNTAIRGSFAVNTQAVFGSQGSMWAVTTAPPILESPSIFFDNIDTFLNAGAVTFPPGELFAFDPQFKPPLIYQYQLGVQQDIGGGTVLDVSYVGNTGHRLYQTRQINTIAPGSRFQDSAVDPTTGGVLRDTFLRPYFGYEGIRYQENSGWSNYNSLQVSLNRRFSQGLQYGVSYTYSKSMGLSSGDRGGLPIYRDIRGYLYGKTSFDQTHMLVFNYLWSLPNATVFAKNAFAKALFHNWEVAGITTFASGFPSGVGFSYTDGRDRWGGGDAPRANMVQDPIIDNKSFDRWFNTGSVAPPGDGDFGNAPRDVFRGPGLSIWDFTLYKNIPVHEQARFQLRWEMYNMFNQTSFSGVDSGARFTPDGQQINGNFGRVNSARGSRQMQVSIRFEF